MRRLVAIGAAAALTGGLGAGYYLSQPATDPNGPMPDPYVIRWTQNLTVDGMCFNSIRAGAFARKQHNVAVQLPSATVQLPSSLTEHEREQRLLAAIGNPPTVPRRYDPASRSRECEVTSP